MSPYSRSGGRIRHLTLAPQHKEGAVAAGLLLPRQLSMVRGKQAATAHAESDAADQRLSRAQTPVGERAQLYAAPRAWGDGD